MSKTGDHNVSLTSAVSGRTQYEDAHSHFSDEMEGEDPPFESTDVAKNPRASAGVSPVKEEEIMFGQGVSTSDDDEGEEEEISVEEMTDDDDDDDQVLVEEEDEDAAAGPHGPAGTRGGAGADTPANAAGQSSQVDFLKDSPEDMTWSRRLALRFIDYGWYNPKAGEQHDDSGAKSAEDPQKAETERLLRPGMERSSSSYPFTSEIEEQPSLQKAWAYFEHVALSRYVLEPKEQSERKSLIVRILRKFRKGNKQLQMAEPGENELPTKLYDPIFTPHKQLGDFGLGIGLYFSTLRAITILTFLAGVLSTPNFYLLLWA